MNALLIHNDNLPTDLTEGFKDRLLFNISQATTMEYDFSFDREAHNQLKEVLKDKLFDVIFIPYTLSNQNYLELSGLRLALHIRLTKEFGHHKVPIVFIGHETAEQIMKLSDLGTILFTSGIFTTNKFDIEDIKKQYKWILNEWKPEKEAKLNNFEYNQFLDKIQIKPAGNYQSHHSIDNELTLARWSEYLKCDDNIPEVKNNLNFNLYFKYSRCLNPLTPIKNPINPYCINIKKAKILLIDDEAEKGWQKFYDTFFKNSKSSIEFDYLKDIDFKTLSQEEIIKEAVKRVRDFDPNIVLLDLRLCDDDFDDNIDPKKLTGYKITKQIKDINRGIQVIITTASNKVWNYETLYDEGIDGYILKNTTFNIAEDIKNLRNVISKSIERKYLKEFYKKMSLLKNNFKELFLNDDYTLSEIENFLNISYNLLEQVKPNDNTTNKYFNYAFLQLYLIIELLANRQDFLKVEGRENCSIEIENKDIYIQKVYNEGVKRAIKFDEKNHYYTLKQDDNPEKTNPDLNFKISSLLIFRYGNENSSVKGWPNINKNRNTKVSHYNNKQKGENIKICDINEILDFLVYISDQDNVNNKNIDNGLH
ncbi:hypothetical protein KRX57_04790 [Weeksellaceae bacterium TAE3-ERU29]|nr:hypothetical protein [Weeksellaceae bacterium TAE3-ERU29]